ncbi:hypothetical protein AB6A40_009571 [Gnathostoma spinigerum]|uniref:Uncharacterized protein n=1 Tax=Gnathostoma spinigerum TaxID=75299 RepID=A0ABD6F0X0_9BILA
MRLNKFYFTNLKLAMIGRIVILLFTFAIVYYSYQRPAKPVYKWNLLNWSGLKVKERLVYLNYTVLIYQPSLNSFSEVDDEFNVPLRRMQLRQRRIHRDY